MVDLAMLDLLSKLANIFGLPALAALVAIVWRFDRRLYRLEVLFQDRRMKL